MATHDNELDIILVEDPKQAPENRCPIKEKEIIERFNYYRNGWANGPTRHGDDCLSDADTGL